MKKTILSVLVLFTISTGINAQTIQERIAAKLAAKLAKSKAVSSRITTMDPNVSQGEVVTTWKDGTYKVYRFNGEASAAKGEVEIKFIKEGGKVVSVMYGETEYRPDQEGVSEFIRYYKSKGTWNLIFTKDWAYVFTGDGGSTRSGKYFINKAGRYNDAKLIEKYLADSKVNQAEDIAANMKKEGENAAKKAAEEKAKWSIKGKKVTKIEVIDIKAPYSFGYYRSFSFQVKATLADGKTISTKDGGFWTDYIITYTNGDVKSKTIQDTRFIKGDKIIVTVKSKYDSKIVATGEVIMDYSETLTLNNNSNNWGKSAFSYKLEVKQQKHAVTGKDIILIKVTDLSGYKRPKYMIIDADQSLNIYANGHNGYKTVGKGNQTGPGANAGDGGNITVYKDPSVTKFNINYTMNGGIGGAGTYGYNRGRDGRDGKYKEIVRAVNF